MVTNGATQSHTLPPDEDKMIQPAQRWRLLARAAAAKLPVAYVRAAEGELASSDALPWEDG
jgi:hypothetical protein